MGNPRQHRRQVERKSPPQTAPVRQDLAIEAIALSGRWQRVARGHLAFSAGCTCSFGSSIDLRELDDFILDYLRNKFIDSPQIVACIDIHGGTAATHPGSLQALLRVIASGRAGLDAAQAAALLREVGGSIASVEEQHP